MPDTTDADARRDSVPHAGSLPFFARFLEAQHGEERSAATMKYPSEDSVLQAGPQSQTLKYPSDRDEWEPFNDSTLQAVPERRSLKYPSDRDEDIEPFHNS
jgi:hypothetical protein